MFQIEFQYLKIYVAKSNTYIKSLITFISNKIYLTSNKIYFQFNIITENNLFYNIVN